jgi:hypothetical protein
MMLSNLPVARSAAARNLFLATLAITVVIHLWAAGFSATDGLTPIFVNLFVLLDDQAAACALVILLLALFVPAGFPARALLRWIGEHPLGIAAAAAIVMSAGTLYVYRNHPLAMDEYAAYLQSQAFAAGSLTGRFPPQLLDWLIPEGFQNHFIWVSRSSGAVASTYWPSFALLLTPFSWLGIPWVCNPLLSAATLVAIHRLAMRIFANAESAGIALLLTIASPVFFANGISYYSMPAHLLANTLFALLLIDATPRRAVLAGFVGSVALTLHNPVPHILFALPWLIWIAIRPRGLTLCGWLAAGYAPLCLLLGVGWFLFSVHLTHDGLSAPSSTSAQIDVLRQIAAVFTLPSSTLLLARLIGVAKIWLWSVSPLMILAGIGAWKWRHHAVCRLLLLSAIATLLGYLLVPVDQGHGWGFRYFHSAWVALPILAAGALTRVPGTEQREEIFGNHDMQIFVLGCALLTLVLGVGLRAFQMREFITAQLANMPAYTGTERRVVIIDPSFHYYAADLVQNDAFLREDIIRMYSHGAARDAEMMHQQFPDMQQVYADKFGSVWSAAAQHSPAGTSGP